MDANAARLDGFLHRVTQGSRHLCRSRVLRCYQAPYPVRYEDKYNDCRSCDHPSEVRKQSLNSLFHCRCLPYCAYDLTVIGCVDKLNIQFCIIQGRNIKLSPFDASVLTYSSSSSSSGPRSLSPPDLVGLWLPLAMTLWFACYPANILCRQPDTSYRTHVKLQRPARGIFVTQVLNRSKVNTIRRLKPSGLLQRFS